MRKINTINKLINCIYILIVIAAIFQFLEYCGQNFPSEFFITYNHGLIRRGFFGNLLFLFCSFFQLNSTLFIKTVAFSLVIINITLISFAVFKKKLDWFILFTSTMLLNIYAKNIPFRLDLVLIILFISQIFILKTNKLNINIKLIVTSLLICLGITIHEIYFIISTFCIAYIMRYILNQKSLSIYISVFILPFILFIGFTYFYNGNIDQISKIIEDWTVFGTKPSDLGYLSWLFSISGGIYIWNNGNFVNNPMACAGLIINCIALCSLYYFFLNYFFELNTKKNKLLILANFCIILFLCCIAEDFIRWFYFMFLFTLFYFMVFENKKETKITSKYVAIKFLFLFVGAPMVGTWNITLFLWSMPIRYLKFYYYLLT